EPKPPGAHEDVVAGAGFAQYRVLRPELDADRRQVEWPTDPGVATPEARRVVDRVEAAAKAPGELVARALGQADLDLDHGIIGRAIGIDAHRREPLHRVQRLLGCDHRRRRVALAGLERDPRAHRLDEGTVRAGDLDRAERAQRARIDHVARERD